MANDPIYVTRTKLPPLEDYVKYLEKIWPTANVTNGGPLVLELEKKLRETLGTKHVFFVSNGTIAIQIALKACGLLPGDEVITTPFSYVATTSSISWEGFVPVFADIGERNLSPTPDNVRAKVSARTRALLATHVYGYPCPVEEYAALSKEFGFKVIYDAAHAFGASYRSKPLASFGDIATLSFHATKIFHTCEGGAIVTNDEELAGRISYMRNFGHNGQDEFWGIGINGKASELHAAMGLCNLPMVAEVIRSRQAVCDLYEAILKENVWGLERPFIHSATGQNYSYYPVLFGSESELLMVRDAMNADNIFPRRYFYPSLNRLPYVSGAAPVAESVSTRILCLPLHADLTRDQVERICRPLLRKL